VIVFDKFLIDGEWVAPDGRGHFDVHDAATEELMGRVPGGSPVDVDRAAATARSSRGRCPRPRSEPRCCASSPRASTSAGRSWSR